MAIIGLLAIIGMSGKDNTQQAAPVIALPVYKTSAYLPIHMLSTPSAASYQNDCYSCVRNEVVGI